MSVHTRGNIRSQDSTGHARLATGIPPEDNPTYTARQSQKAARALRWQRRAGTHERRYGTDHDRRYRQREYL